MVSVYFNCSSPYVGFTIRQADYLNNTMRLCSVKTPIMPSDCYELFSNGGSTLLLGRFGNHRYLQATQTETENYDEQGRRIYASVAFSSGSAADVPVINRIAAYAFFNEKTFYEEIAKMIILLKDGFTVDFARLSAFLERFAREGVFQSNSQHAKSVYQAIIHSEGKYDIDLVVLEATWDYLVNQVGRKFTKNDLCCFAEDRARTLAEKGHFEFMGTVAAEKPVAEESVNKETPLLDKPEQDNLTGPKTVSESITVSENIKMQTSVAYAAERDQIRKLKAENAEQKTLLAKAEEKVLSLSAEIVQLKEKMKKSFLLGLIIGIIGTVLAVLMIGKLACTNTTKTPAPAGESLSVIETTWWSDTCDMHVWEGAI